MKKYFFSFLLCSLLYATSVNANGKPSANSDSFNLLEASNSGAADATLNIANGHTVLTIIDAKPGLSFDIEVGQLHGEQGDLVTPEIVYAGSAKRIQKDIRVEGTLLELPLNVTLPNPGKYQGILSITTKDGGIKKWRLSLSRAGISRPATLTVDQNTITPATVTRPWYGNFFTSEKTGPAFSLRLWEKNRAWPLNNINVRLDGAAKAPGDGLNLSKDISLKFDGEKWDERKQRIIQAEKQAEVTINFTKLDAGEYSVPLRFIASNADDSDSQKVTLTMHVRDSIFWSILTLALAVLLSMLATKLKDAKLTRIKLKERISQLRSDGLGQDDPSPQVVWARATLRQVDELSRRGNGVLAGTEEINQRITQAEKVIGVLNSARDLRAKIDNMKDKAFTCPRAYTALGRVLKPMIDMERIDENAAQKYKDAITALSAWTLEDSAQQKEIYWADLSSDIKILLGSIESNEPPGEVLAAIRAHENHLKDALTTLPTTLDDIKECDRHFQVLRVLWRWRDEPEFDDLCEIVRPENNLKEFFSEADKMAWSRLKKSKLSIRLKNNIEATTVESFNTLQFEVKSADDVVNESYLFKHLLKFKWKLTLQGEGKPVWLRPETTEPQLAQYAPKKGQFIVDVLIDYAGEVYGEDKDKSNIESLALTVEESDQFNNTRELANLEYASLGYVGALAIVSGLSLYYKNPTFGSSVEDYLLLFLWGAGLDQGKNWIQISKQP